MLKKCLLSLTLLIIFSKICFANSLNALPDVGSYSQSNLSAVDERELGRSFMRQVTQKFKLSHDPIVVDYIQHLGKRLSSSVNHNKQHFYFFVVKDGTINAFAGPNGYIGVNTGLITAMKSEGELAAVLAHEIAHVNQHHLARMIERNKQLRMSSIASTLIGILLGAVNPALGASVISAGVGGSMQNMIGFTRENEKEADRIGINTLYLAGYDPLNMPKLFNVIHSRQQFYPDDIPVYLRTHPMNYQRIADAKDRVNDFPQKKYHLNNLSFKLIQARIEVNDSHDHYQTLSLFKNKMQNQDDIIAAKYGRSLVYAKLRDYQKSLKLIDELIAKNPNQIWYTMSKADIYADMHNPKQALKIIKPIYQSNPDYYPAVVQYANTLLLNQDYRQAKTFIENQISQHPKKIELYAMLATAEAKTGDLSQAYQTRGKVLAAMGDIKNAKLQFHLAMQNTKSSFEKERIQGFLERLNKLGAS